METDQYIKEYYKNGQIEWDSPKAKGLGQSVPKRHGLARHYFPDGTLHIERLYDYGNIEGVERTYYQNGMLYKGIEYKDGIRNGLYLSFYFSGRPKIECNYKNDVKSGKFKRWKEDRTLDYATEFIKGKEQQ